MGREKGQALVIVAIVLLSIIGLLALVVDTGRAYIDHSRLQRGVDAAVLAGVQEFPSTDDQEAREIAREGFEANMNKELLQKSMYNYNMTTFINPKTKQYDTMLLTADTVINNKLAHFLGYPEWPIVAQAGARSGPIGKIQHWIPIGVEGGSIELYQHYRLSNEDHDIGENTTGGKRLYKPLNRGNLRQGVANTIKQEISVGNKLQIANNANMLDVCKGIDDRMKAKVGHKGCFNVDEAHPGINEGANIVGPGVRDDWRYGSDPRLVYIPFVKQVDNNNVEIVGFGLFYIEYSHYDSNAMGVERPITEIVGFFVRTVVEGPLVPDGDNYGVVGIEYTDFLQSIE